MDQPTPVTTDEQIHNATLLAKNMRNNGASIETIEIRMASRGLDGPAIKAVLHQIPLEEPDNLIIRQSRQNRAGPGRTVLVLVGLMISMLGVLLIMGNRTGLAPTLPFLGFAVMIIGGVLLSAARS
ncbi:MAG: hypothetical protein NVSMB9_22020 [Isosphaeraceae bacterium]